MKRKISAKEFLADARAGFTDLGLMDKYHLSMPAIQGLFKQLVEAGLMSPQELEERLPLTERSLTQRIFRCPACKMPQFDDFDECPQCGVIISKLSQTSQLSDAQNPPQATTPTPIVKPPEPPPRGAIIGYEPFAVPPESIETAPTPDPISQSLDTPARSSNTIKISVLIPMDMLDELNGLGGGLSEHVTEAVKIYLAARRTPSANQE